MSTNGSDSELISLMSQAGCQMVLIGGPVVSMQNDKNESSGIESSLEQLTTLCDLCHSQGLPYSITQAFGEPGETDKTISIKLAGLSQVAGTERSAHVNMRIGNRLLPGSPLLNLAIQDGLINEETDLLMPVFYVEPSVKPHIVDTLKAAAGPNSNWHIM